VRRGLWPVGMFVGNVFGAGMVAAVLWATGSDALVVACALVAFAALVLWIGAFRAWDDAQREAQRLGKPAIGDDHLERLRRVLAAAKSGLEGSRVVAYENHTARKMLQAHVPNISRGLDEWDAAVKRHDDARPALNRRLEAELQQLSVPATNPDFVQRLGSYIASRAISGRTGVAAPEARVIPYPDGTGMVQIDDVIVADYVIQDDAEAIKGDIDRIISASSAWQETRNFPGAMRALESFPAEDLARRIEDAAVREKIMRSDACPACGVDEI
jgi:hypothetical protein